MTVHSDERGRRLPTPAALSSLEPVVDGFRILPDPLHGQALIRVPARPAQVRVMLDRSLESALAGEPTQDYLAVRCDPRRLSFAVTDGVGSSFLGDVAAQILAAHLADWLAGAELTSSGALEVGLTGFLRELSVQMADRVATWPIPETASPVVRAALDQQRGYGSEAMFAAGVVDLAGGRGAMAAVAWLGDARVRVFHRGGTQIDHSGQTNDRWSSRLGPRGPVRGQVWPVTEVVRLLACTDGLNSEFDAAVQLPDEELAVRLGALAGRPGNDDIALVDLGLTAKALPGGPGGSTLSRLFGESEGRHARPTPAGSALRRIMRAVGPTAPTDSASTLDNGSDPVPEAKASAGGPSAPSGGAAGVGPSGMAGASGPTVRPPRSPDAPPPVVGVARIAPGSALRPPSPEPTASTPAGTQPTGSGPPPPAVGPASPAPAAPKAPGSPAAPGAPASHRPDEAPLADVPPPGGVRWQRTSATGYELGWAPVPAAQSYAVQVCLEPTFADPLLYAVRGLTFGVPPMPGRVFVRLRSISADGPGPWGAVFDLAGPAGLPTRPGEGGR